MGNAMRSREYAIARWVEYLNRLGRELDAKAASMHPSAWKEQLREDIERWRRVVGQASQRGPRLID